MKLTALTYVLGSIILLSSCTDSSTSRPDQFSIRALDVVGDSTLWIASSNGFWAKSVNGGTTWDSGFIAGFDGELRDIHAFDDKRAIAMGIASPGIIWKTEDGGNTWSSVFRYDHPSNFFDQLEINEQGQGIIVGDPIDGKWTIVGTNDFGEHWVLWDEQHRYPADSGEVSFAASGSALIVEKRSFAFFTGGYGARMLHSSREKSFRLYEDTSATAGIYSATRFNDSTVVFVGGDYRFEESTKHSAGTIYFTNSGPKLRWPDHTVNGYRSCVKRMESGLLVACGPTGIDASWDGLNWTLVSDEGFHVLAVNNKGNRIWAAGALGTVREVTGLLPSDSATTRDNTNVIGLE
ncbi:WD40/YVTN/BNR-like repeat-containing protein [Phaeocystidibacter luteus]|uniref:Photosynthesis system II assembly factor Ycf48/Hcf136-like domain-containing protein n=1 Tax=Phaeocystidibacter luteus TaxID=911197 RepID=A0A6N6RK87_9FLAO|nr:hypothetical protein [Phaeocystidibacter luteus]KAB2814355.1 hypothetical protein F8C67_01075 [Phaeocystidibacter luteus]